MRLDQVRFDHANHHVRGFRCEVVYRLTAHDVGLPVELVNGRFCNHSVA